MYRTRVKICCISSPLEAELAIRYGVDALGLVADMPSGPGIIDDDLVRDIAQATPPGVETFLLTSQARGAEIVEHVRYCGTTTVQIVRHIDPAEYAEIQAGLPHTRRIQVIHVEDDSALELMQQYEPYVHAFLLDSGRPGAATVELGGTGRTHDWAVSRRFVERSSKPVFLAGGLNPGNVAQAIDEVSPWGLDLCSGVRTDGALDESKLRSFLQSVWTA